MAEERFRPRVGYSDSVECIDRVDGKYLVWVKGIGSHAGDYVLFLGGSEPYQRTSYLGLKTDRRNGQICQIDVVGNQGNITLTHDGYGETTLLNITDGCKLQEPYKITLSWVDKKLRADYPNEAKVRQTTGCLRILDGAGRQRILLEPRINNEFGASSCLWNIKDWAVNFDPIRLQDLLVISPKRWGERAAAQSMARALTNILEAKIRPLT